MKKVLKYGLNCRSNPNTQLPGAAEILSVSYQNGLLQMWALVDTMAPYEYRHFEVFETGQAVPDGFGETYKFIGTAMTGDGGYVSHVFEKLS